MSISFAGKTDISLKRKKNEDQYLIIDNAQSGYGIDRLGKMFAVADGMGGHLGGETASRMACEILLEYYHKDIAENQILPGSLIARLENTIQAAGKRIASASFENQELAGMGTTLSMLLLHSENALIAHVGDSRIYRLRSNELKQLTTDHTQVHELIDMGQVKLHPHSEGPQETP
jgi:protein phosphatase